MPDRRPRDPHMLSLPVTQDEQNVVDTLCTGLGLTIPNLLRTALFSLADYQRIDMPNGVFDLRTGQGHWKRRAPAPIHKGQP